MKLEIWENSQHIVRRISFRSLMFYVVSLAFIVLVYLRFGELQDLRTIFASSHVSWLLVAVFFQILTYHFLSLTYEYVFKIKGHNVSSWQLYPVSLITKFLNQAFPSLGVSGQVYLVDYLRKRGATVAEGIGRAILEIASMFAGFGILFILASVLYLSGEGLRRIPQLIYLLYIFLFFAIIALTTYFTIQRSKEESWLFKLASRFSSDSNGNNQEEASNGHESKLKNYWSVFKTELRTNMNFWKLKSHGNLFLMAIIWQFITMFLDVLTLYALALAIDISIGFVPILIVFTFTKFISMISFVPGSLVIYEGGMSIMLVLFGIESGSALTLALFFRALTFWLPMPIGWLLYRFYEREHRKEMPTEA